MKFNISSKALETCLLSVGKVVAKNNITILENYLFELSGDELVVTGTDGESTIKGRLAVNSGEGEGKFCVNARKFNDMLKELPEQGLEVSVNDETFKIVIKYMNGRFDFQGADGDEYPQKALNDSDSRTFNMPAEEIVKGINQTIFAVGVEDLRPQMMGVLWDIKPEEAVFVASDTHKLVRYKNLRVKSGIEASFILPAKPAANVASIFAKAEGDVAITIDSACATFVTEDFTVNCRFIAGRYPNYNSVINENNPYKASVDRETLLAAIRRVSIFASASGLITFELKPNEIRLHGEDIDYATLAEETVPCEYAGAEMVIGFHKTRVVEVLDNINNDTVVLNLTDPSRAGFFEPETQAEGESLLILLMPMMI